MSHRVAVVGMGAVSPLGNNLRKFLNGIFTSKIGIGGLDTIQNQVIKMDHKGPGRVSPFFVPDAIINMAAGNISINLDARNMSEGIVTACSSGANAIGDAFERVKEGKATYMITGGTEAAINKIGISGFVALTALSKSKNPKKASMPFDKDRNGFVMGEGAGALVLEDWEHAKKRGAHILGEIVGYGSTSDAYKLTAPRPDGSGAIRAMTQAINEGHIAKNDLDYINAHGIATKDNDSAESQAIAACFKNNHHLEVSSTKGMTGHTIGAAGALEAIITISALRRGQMPVNVGCYHQDPETKITLVNKHNNKKPIKTAISNSFGFGGHNAVLAFRKV